MKTTFKRNFPGCEIAREIGYFVCYLVPGAVYSILELAVARLVLLAPFCSPRFDNSMIARGSCLCHVGSSYLRITPQTCRRSMIQYPKAFEKGHGQ